MTMPGWYPDPQDLGWLRYFDGQRWTDDRQAAVVAQRPEPAAPVDPAQPPAQPDVSDLTGPRPPRHGTVLPPAYQPAPQQVPYQPSSEAPTGQAAGPYGGPPAGPQGQWAAPTGQWSPQPEQWTPQTAQWTPQAEQWATPQTAQWPPQAEQLAVPGRRRKRSRLPLVLIVSIVLVAGLATGGWFILHKEKAAAFTFAGKTVYQPEATLSQAEKAVDVIVAQRHGAKSSDTRCYFALPADPPKGTKKSDVDTSVRCGPVLFVDGDPHRTYLSFPVSTSASPHGSVSLAAASSPVSADPAALPAGLTLSRPDGQMPPADGSLKVPPPPPALKGTLVAAFLTGQSLAAAPRDALMASLRGGIKVTKLGVVKRYGSGDNARTAPAGQRLAAFTFTTVPGQIGNVSPVRGQIGLSVNGGASRALPDSAKGQVIVAAIPVSGHADLVLHLDGIKQTISIPGGKPGSRNLAVLRRSHIDASLSVNAPMTIKFTQGSTSANLAGRVTATHALIGYWTDDGKHHASNGTKALLWMDFRFRVPNQADQTGVDAPLLTIKPSGGPTIRAKDLDPSDKVWAVFEVAANFTHGIVTISGTEPGSTKISVVTPVKFGVSIPS
jgi:hypothetical protein